MLRLETLATESSGKSPTCSSFIQHSDRARVVVVIMALSSLAFYGMAFRVPVVRMAQEELGNEADTHSKNACSIP